MLLGRAAAACLKATALGAVLLGAMAVGDDDDFEAPRLNGDAANDIRTLLFYHTVSGWGFLEDASRSAREGGGRQTTLYLNDGFCTALAIQEHLESHRYAGQAARLTDPRHRSALSAWLWARVGSASDPIVVGYWEALARIAPLLSGIGSAGWHRTLMGAQGLFFLRAAALHTDDPPGGRSRSGATDDRHAAPFQETGGGKGIYVERSLVPTLVDILKNPSPQTYVPPEALRGGAAALAGWLDGLVPSLSIPILRARSSSIRYDKIARFADLPEDARLLALHLMGFLHGVPQEDGSAAGGPSPRPFLSGFGGVEAAAGWRRRRWWTPTTGGTLTSGLFFEDGDASSSSSSSDDDDSNGGVGALFALTGPRAPGVVMGSGGPPGPASMASIASILDDARAQLAPRRIVSAGSIRSDPQETPGFGGVEPDADAPEYLWKRFQGLPVHPAPRRDPPMLTDGYRRNI